MTRVVRNLSRLSRAGCALATVLVVMSLAGWAQAQDDSLRAERYVAGVWIDPDGCEHWVMDDGAEGYMSPHLTREGKPVCHAQNICAEVASDQTFSPDSAEIGPSGRERLRAFFKANDAASYKIRGHTDSSASDAYNMTLSKRRANAVAAIARNEGARVSDVRGYGERKPKASNETADGMAQNRRVEILCVR